MIRPRYWTKHLVARRALRGYPLYDVPHKRAERTITKGETQENFEYFINVRLSRLAYFVDWMNEHFATKPSLDGNGLRSVSDWVDQYGGGLIRYSTHVTLDAWAAYEPAWIDEYAGLNLTIDIGIFLGEYLIAKRQQLRWEIDWGHEFEPASFESIEFGKPCLAGFPGHWTGFPLSAGLRALLNARDLATFGNTMSRSKVLILDAQKNLYRANMAEDGAGDYRNEPL